MEYVKQMNVSLLVGPGCNDMIDDVQKVSEKKCVSMLMKIMKDSSHPLHVNFRFLRSERRLNMPYCRTDRHKSTFVPSAVKLYNSISS